ncbi:MAG: hypothetical protein ICV66_08480 [Chitinophagaceae bacterium]|nr:hypothetical protein [Chitinophagaceae bacterium]
MSAPNFVKAGVLAIAIVISFIAAWEIYWRSKGFPVSYNDDESLWCTVRKKVYKPIDQATVFIGSSRNKFDVDIATWEQQTGGDEVIQLSCVGTSPRPLLHDLANDKNFRGKLIIDVTEPIFFSRDKMRREKSAVDRIKYYKDWTPAQKASSVLNYPIESAFVFLDEDKFSLNAFLEDLEIPNRPGIFVFPRFPKEFGLSKANRQDYMMERFEKDTELQRRQTNNWVKLGALDKRPAISGDSLVMVFEELKKSIDKIRARGGQVIFLRTPSSGGYWETESVVYPREKYWDQMLKYTNTQGIHFKNYPAIANFICPEWSHLSSKDAVIFTRELVRILREEKGWKFRNSNQEIAKF